MMKKLFGILLIMSATVSSVFATAEGSMLVEGIQETQEQIENLNKAYKENLEKHQSKIANLERQINEKETQSGELSELIKTLEENKRKLKEEEDLENEKQKTTATELRKKIAAQKQKIKNLEKEAEDDESNKKALEGLKKKLKTSEKALTEKNSEFNKSKDVNAKIVSEINNAKANLQEEVNEQQNELKRLKENKKEAEAADKEENKNFEDEINRLKTENTKLNEGKKRFEKTITSAGTAVTDMQKAVAKMQKNIATTKEKEAGTPSSKPLVFPLPLEAPKEQNQGLIAKTLGETTPEQSLQIPSEIPPPPPLPKSEIKPAGKQQASQADVMAKIREGNFKLRPASERKLAPKKQTQGGENQSGLLSQIRKGTELKHVDTEALRQKKLKQIQKDKEENPLYKKLRQRRKAMDLSINNDTDNDDGNE